MSSSWEHQTLAGASAHPSTQVPLDSFHHDIPTAAYSRLECFSHNDGFGGIDSVPNVFLGSLAIPIMPWGKCATFKG